MASSSSPVIKDINWIKQSLQNAIELEFSTLPVYLSCMFSLKVQNYTVYNTVRSVAMEEMVHMAIAANLLSAIGGSPAIKNIKVSYPTRGLPGGVEPDLQIGLASFSKPQLQNFMRLEAPQFLIPELDLPEDYPTIGLFYNDIKKAIGDNAEQITAAIKKGGTSKQIGDTIGLPTFVFSANVDPVKMLCDGIDEIMEQGEGASAKKIITSTKFETEESHYAKFASLFYGHIYQKPKGLNKLTRKNEAKFFTGAPIGWPEVINTLAVPADGYAKALEKDPAGQTTGAYLAAFDTAFSDMLTTLDVVWNGPANATWKPIDPAAKGMIDYGVFTDVEGMEQNHHDLGSAVHGMLDFRVFSSFSITRMQISDSVIAQLPALYPDEIDFIKQYTDLTKPVFYGPRFINTNA
jgi:hypothetical protein